MTGNHSRAAVAAAAILLLSGCAGAPQPAPVSESAPLSPREPWDAVVPSAGGDGGHTADSADEEAAASTEPVENTGATEIADDTENPDGTENAGEGGHTAGSADKEAAASTEPVENTGATEIADDTLQAAGAATDGTAGGTGNSNDTGNDGADANPEGSAIGESTDSLNSEATAPPDDIPMPVGWVNDFGDVIPAELETEMTLRIQSLREATGAEIAVLIVESYAPFFSIEEFGRSVANYWGLGTVERRAGVLVTVALEERQVRIDVGYGLEAVIPDHVAGRVLDEAIVPYLREDDYGTAMSAGVEVIAELIAEAYDR